MAAKWQQWMPLDVNEWRGSPAVKAMHPTARSGYLDLLLAQWQTDDCSLSGDPFDLAELSGLGDDLWAQYGPRILRKFEQLENGRLRNAVCFAKWEDAKRVFEARKVAADRTNSARSPRPNKAVTDHGPRRSANTRTWTETETGTETEKRGEERAQDAPPLDPAPLRVAECVRADWEAEPAENIPEGMSLVQYATFACDELQAARGNWRAMENAIKAIAQHEGQTLAQATRTWIQRARDHPPAPGKSWTFHVNDGGWKAKEEFHLEIAE